MPENRDSGEVYYVCCATGQMQTNWQALRAYAPERVKGILILVGMSDPVNPSENDRMQAQEPAERFARAAVSLGYPRPKLISGKTASFECWVKPLVQWMEEVPDKTVPVIFNVTGGTKPMNFGGAQGLRNGLGLGGNLQPRIVYVDRGHALYEQGALPEARRALPELALEDFLAMHGYAEPRESRSRRLVHQETALARKAVTLRIWHELQNDQKFQVNLLPLLADAILNSRKKKIEGGSGISMRRADLDSVLYGKTKRPEIFKRIINKLCLLCSREVGASLWIRSLKGETLECSSDFTKWLGGQWVEELAFIKVHQVIAAKGLDAEAVHLGVRLHRVDGNGQALGEPDRDFDVAFVAKGQLHVIECKTGAFPKAADRQALIKYLMAVRQEVSGLHGLVGLLHPREAIKLGGAHERIAQDHGLSFWQGSAALKELEKAVTQRL